jgi:hypothetical protein
MPESTELSVLQNNPLAKSDAFKHLLDTNDTLIGSSFPTGRRISLKGCRFRMIVNGEQIKVSKQDWMNIIILQAAPLARTFYEGTYDPDKAAPPVCWSNDTKVPAEDVGEPQGKSCADCPQNIKGSGQGDTRACRFSQKLAILLEGDMETVYQLNLPATSIFGEAKENELGMQAYARFLQEHKTPAIAVVTQMRFDEESEMPKLFFKPERVLEEHELEQAVTLMDSEAVTNAITFKVFDTDKGKNPNADHATDDGVEKAEAAAKEQAEAERKEAEKAEKLAKLKAEMEALEEEETSEDDEPTKRESTSDEPEPEEKSGKLAAMMDQWDD